MRQKNTDIVEGQDFHKQYQDTPDQRKINKYLQKSRSKRDEKQGQSDFRVKKQIKTT